jgi:hypothetical protein
MASCNTIFLIKMMTLWNYLCELYINITDKCLDLYYYLKDYYHGHHDIWLFVPGHTFPLSLSSINNMIHINWIYDNSNNSLTIGASDKLEKIRCKFSWLSAKIRIIHAHKQDEAIEYDIDDFINKFNINTVESVVPTLYMVFMCWCAYTKHWFRPDDYIEFHVIDDMGEEIVLNLEDHNESLVIKRNKIYVVIHSGEDEPTTEQNKVIEPDTKGTDETPLLQENKNKDE